MKKIMIENNRKTKRNGELKTKTSEESVAILAPTLLLDLLGLVLEGRSLALEESALLE